MAQPITATLLVSRTTTTPSSSRRASPAASPPLLRRTPARETPHGEWQSPPTHLNDVCASAGTRSTSFGFCAFSPRRSALESMASCMFFGLPQRHTRNQGTKGHSRPRTALALASRSGSRPTHRGASAPAQAQSSTSSQEKYWSRATNLIVQSSWCLCGLLHWCSSLCVCSDARQRCAHGLKRLSGHVSGGEEQTHCEPSSFQHVVSHLEDILVEGRGGGGREGTQGTM